jgi:hypothetical protein
MVPLIDDFERVMRNIGMGEDEFGNPLYANDQQRKYQHELLGARVIIDAPWLYWDSLAMLDSGIAHVWDKLTVRQRARIKAVMRIRNMAETIEKHRSLQHQKAEQSNLGKI